MDGMSSDFFVNNAGRLSQFSGDQRQINFFHCARGELFRQFSMRHVVLSYHEAAACFLIETVNDAGSFFSADPRQSGTVTKQSVDQSMFALTGARMNRHAGRFVDNNEIIVFEENIQRNRFWLDVDFFRRRLDEINLVTGSDNLPWSTGSAVEPNEPAPD